jgi:hypothetical protein
MMRKSEQQDVGLKQTIDKCSELCRQIRGLCEELDDDGLQATKSLRQTKDEIVLETLQSVIKEKREIQVKY